MHIYENAGEKQFRVELQIESWPAIPHHALARFNLPQSVTPPTTNSVATVTPSKSLYFNRHSFVIIPLAIQGMNYTGNPRHYRSHPGPPSALKGYFRRQCALLERPLLAICQEFQDPSPDTGTDAKSPLRVSCISTEQETFETKRRRILHQKDWLGLDISSPINVSVIARSILIIRYTRYEMPRNSDVAPTVRS